MEAGQLRHRVTIESQTAVDGDYGKTLGDYAAVGKPRPARVRPLRAAERLKAGEVDQVTEHVVSMRFTRDVTPQCRLRWEGKILEVNGIIDVNGRGIELEIMCTEKEAATTNG